MTLKYGDKGTAVTVLQKALRLPLVDGRFGPRTRAAVVTFQRTHRLTANGIVTTPVWRALSAVATAPRPTAPAPRGTYAAYEKVTLKYGSRGTAVTVLQRALRLPLVDGQFGPRTRAAVVTFESRHHLTANGIVTTAVWRALG